VLTGWGVRGYNTEWAFSGQHEVAPKVSVAAGWYRRAFANKTVTVDNRYGLAGQRGFTWSSIDGPLCAHESTVTNLPNRGGYQDSGAAPTILATWTTTPASATTLGRAYANAATTKSVDLMAVGQNYGNDNLKQLDMRFSKRFRMDRYRFRIDLDAYNVFNSD